MPLITATPFISPTFASTILSRSGVEWYSNLNNTSSSGSMPNLVGPGSLTADATTAGKRTDVPGLVAGNGALQLSSARTHRGYTSTIDSNNPNLGTGSCTIECFINITVFPITHSYRLVSVYNNTEPNPFIDNYVRVSVRDTGIIEFISRNPPSAPTSLFWKRNSLINIVDGLPHHIVCQRDALGATDNDKMKIWIDGVEDTGNNADIIGSSANNVSTDFFTIGGTDLSDDFSMEGIIDEVVVYNRTVSQSEIIQSAAFKL